MNYWEEWNTLESKLREVQKLKPLSGYVRDGIVNLAYWQRQNIRPLFMGKEAHGGKKSSEKKVLPGSRGWSITEASMNRNPVGFCRASRHSWPKTAYVAYALQNNFAVFKPEWKKDKTVLEALRTVAFINVGKQVGDTRTSSERLLAMYKQNRMLLHEQLALCQPNVIVYWNTLGVFEADSVFRDAFKKTATSTVALGGMRSWTANGCIHVAARHPAYFKVSPSQYVNSIVETVRKYVDAGQVNLDLPTGSISGLLASPYPKPARHD